MASESSSGNIRTVLNNLEVKLNELYTKTKDETCTENESFDIEEFWKAFDIASKIISHEATKFTMAFEKPPTPSISECQPLVDGIECAMQNIVALFLNFPPSGGKTLLEDIRKLLCPLVLSMKELCSSAVQPGAGLLQRARAVWDKCSLAGGLPQDNKEAVLRICDAEYSLVDDAVAELMDAVENETEGNAEDEIRHAFLQNGIRIPCPTKWSEADRNIVMPSLGLIKVCRTCLKKTFSTVRDKARASDESCISELDEIASIIKSSSSHVDDLASSLYPPLYRSAIIQHGLFVHTTCKNLLNCLESCSSLVAEAELTWINFLHQALDHNWELINERITTR